MSYPDPTIILTGNVGYVEHPFRTTSEQNEFHDDLCNLLLAHGWTERLVALDPAARTFDSTPSEIGDILSVSITLGIMIKGYLNGNAANEIHISSSGHGTAIQYMAMCNPYQLLVAATSFPGDSIYTVTGEIGFTTDDFIIAALYVPPVYRGGITNACFSDTNLNRFRFFDPGSNNAFTSGGPHRCTAVMVNGVFFAGNNYGASTPWFVTRNTVDTVSFPLINIGGGGSLHPDCLTTAGRPMIQTPAIMLPNAPDTESKIAGILRDCFVSLKNEETNIVVGLSTGQAYKLWISGEYPGLSTNEPPGNAGLWIAIS